MSTALGPGTTSTASPASRHARTSCSPGSDTPGMPASVTYATRLPERTASTIVCAPARSLCAWIARSRPAAGTPACVSNPRVRRVSSAAITSASRSTSTARATGRPGFRSESRRVPATPLLRVGHPRSSTRSPDARSPAFERARTRLDHERGAPHDRRHPAGSQRARPQHEAAHVAERDVDREPHPERVDVAARPEHEHAVDRVAAEEPAPAGTRVRAQLRPSRALPRHGPTTWLKR